ncbi:hypothetical protein CHARACLAT_031070 [Characodon lateralis]|uniref:Uncharacterized protein n=1 Tax=Characodon lateralis TaxID=208331 RepID=A0ABU7EEC5_9TELE|nr:hypothetical protein [Characodon lateralis]
MICTKLLLYQSLPGSEQGLLKLRLDFLKSSCTRRAKFSPECLLSLSNIRHTSVTHRTGEILKIYEPNSDKLLGTQDIRRTGSFVLFQLQSRQPSGAEKPTQGSNIIKTQHNPQVQDSHTTSLDISKKLILLPQKSSHIWVARCEHVQLEL